MKVDSLRGVRVVVGRISLLTVPVERRDAREIEGVLGKVDGAVRIGIVYGKVRGLVGCTGMRQAVGFS